MRYVIGVMGGVGVVTGCRKISLKFFPKVVETCVDLEKFVGDKDDIRD